MAGFKSDRGRRKIASNKRGKEKERLQRKKRCGKKKSTNLGLIIIGAEGSAKSRQV